MSENARELLVDEALVLHVKDYQTADKLVVCFTKKHGKLRFIAYGAPTRQGVPSGYGPDRAAECSQSVLPTRRCI